MLKVLALALILAGSGLTATSASAGSLEVGPIRVLMIGPERTSTLTLRNSGSTPMRVQVRTVDWNQPNGEDAYTPSAVLLASPPLVNLGPSESQVIRVVVQNLPKGPAERSFRLIFDELPPAKAEGTGVQAALRVLVPVFVTPATSSRPKLKWTAARVGGNVRLTAHNDGEARDRLVGLRVTAGGQPLGAGPLEGYVLARSSRSWTLPATRASSLMVEGAGEFGLARANVPIAP